MRQLLTGWLCLVTALASAAPEFVSQEVQVGKTKFSLPVLKELQWVSRETSWARSFFELNEHRAKDPGMNFTLVVVMVSPGQYAQASKVGHLTGSDCTVVVPTVKLEARHNLKQFRSLVDGMMEDAGLVAMVTVQTKDENIRKVMAGLSEETFLDRTDRSIQMLIGDGSHLIANAYVLVEGKVLIMNLRRPKQEAKELMADMDAWVAEILKKTKA